MSIIIQNISIRIVSEVQLSKITQIYTYKYIQLILYQYWYISIRIISDICGCVYVKSRLPLIFWRQDFARPDLRGYKVSSKSA